MFKLIGSVTNSVARKDGDGGLGSMRKRKDVQLNGKVRKNGWKVGCEGYGWKDLEGCDRVRKYVGSKDLRLSGMVRMRKEGQGGYERRNTLVQ